MKHDPNDILIGSFLLMCGVIMIFLMGVGARTLWEWIFR